MKKLCQGNVYFTQHRDVSSSKPHYLIVLNPNPDSSSVIVLGVITSGIENAKKRIAINKEDPATLVTITPKDYCLLDHDSVVDCNSPVKYHKWELEQSFGQLKATQKIDMSIDICNSIIHGIMLSKTVSQKIKNELQSY